MGNGGNYMVGGSEQYPPARSSMGIPPGSMGLRPGSALDGPLGGRERRRRDRDEDRGDGEDEVITTIFVVGFPDDMLVSDI